MAESGIRLVEVSGRLMEPGLVEVSGGLMEPGVVEVSGGLMEPGAVSGLWVLVAMVADSRL